MSVASRLLIGVLIAFSRPADRQIGYLWTFEELKTKADLVVIAEFVATEETGRQTEHPELRPAFPVVELRTEFKVLAILKSDPSAPPSGSDGRIRVKHYRIDGERWRRLHPAPQGGPPPGLVNAGSALNFRESKGPYLLFLASRSGGVIEPLSGHTFPTDSVYLLGHLR